MTGEQLQQLLRRLSSDGSCLQLAVRVSVRDYLQMRLSLLIVFQAIFLSRLTTVTEVQETNQLTRQR